MRYDQIAGVQKIKNETELIHIFIGIVFCRWVFSKT